MKIHQLLETNDFEREPDSAATRAILARRLIQRSKRAQEKLNALITTSGKVQQAVMKLPDEKWFTLDKYAPGWGVLDIPANQSLIRQLRKLENDLNVGFDHVAATPTDHDIDPEEAAFQAMELDEKMSDIDSEADILRHAKKHLITAGGLRRVFWNGDTYDNSPIAQRHYAKVYHGRIRIYVDVMAARSGDPEIDETITRLQRMDNQFRMLHKKREELIEKL